MVLNFLLTLVFWLFEESLHFPATPLLSANLLQDREKRSHWIVTAPLVMAAVLGQLQVADIP
jgi:hypothetical protein